MTRRYGKGGPCKICGRKCIPKTVKGKIGKYGYFYHQVCGRCRFRAMRKKAKRVGLCTRCRFRKAAPARTKCAECLGAERERRRPGALK